MSEVGVSCSYDKKLRLEPTRAAADVRKWVDQELGVRMVCPVEC